MLKIYLIYNSKFLTLLSTFVRYAYLYEHVKNMFLN